MAQFRLRSQLEMQPKPGARYATVYYRLRPREYQRVQAHVAEVIELVLAGAIALAQESVLSQELKNFPRMGGRPNYSAADIILDMRDRLATGHDMPSGMSGRWNRLFESFPEECIELMEPVPAKERNLFDTVFEQPKY